MEILLIDSQVQIKQDKQNIFLRQAEKGNFMQLKNFPDNLSPYLRFISTLLITTDTLFEDVNILDHFFQTVCHHITEFAPLEKVFTDKL